MIKAIIFDMDGLMFNTEVMFKDMFHEHLNNAGVSCPESVVLGMIGCDSRQIARYEDAYPGISKVMETCIANRADYFFTYFKEPGSANMLGLKEIIEYVEQENIPYGIASSSLKSDILHFLGHAGFEIHPRVIVSSKEGNIPSKPNPDIFLLAAQRLGVKPEECLVLEDSKHGIHAAYNAHMQSIFIEDQIHPDEEMKQYIQEQRNDLLEVIEYLKQNN